jgi:predicted GNAT family N-acyltransferase
MGVSVRRLDDGADRRAALDLRREVFCEEQGVALEAEVDGRDPQALHLGAYRDGRLIGTLRLLPDEGALHVQRVAVQRELRRHGVGRALMLAAAELARAEGARALALHAQRHSEGFYAGLGYRSHGEPFLEQGIEHVAMRREL